VKELTVQEAALAWAQGKRVEASGPSREWGSIQPPGLKCGTYQPSVFSGDNKSVFKFRLAPVPPAKRYRPWTVEEVPFGSLLRTKGAHSIHMIVAFNTAQNEVYAGRSWVGDVAYCIEHAEHSTDNGKTWLPCGVEAAE